MALGMFCISSVLHMSVLMYSRDRSPPVGYKISAVQFDPNTGSPLAPTNSTTAAIDIVANQNITVCPNACFRPVGLAWDSQGRLFFSSDATGEIYVVARTNGTVAASTPSAVASNAGTSGTATSTASGTSGGAAAATASSTTSSAASTIGGTNAVLTCLMGLLLTVTGFCWIAFA